MMTSSVSSSHVSRASIASNDSLECSICIEPICGRRKQVQCGCDYVVCRDCTKQFLLSTIKEPHCMNCNVAWNRDFLCKNFPKTFLDKEYKDHRKQILLDREKARIPETQDLARRYKDWKERQEKKDELLEELAKEAEPLRQQLERIYRKQSYLHARSFESAGNWELLPKKERTTRKESKPQIVCSCPRNGCKGFIDTSNHECKLCSCVICKDCHVEITSGEEHECKTSDIETKKEIQKSTKACPKCHTRIFKIDGCNQMWCTHCNVAFNWRTGELERGPVHNPHYFQWLREGNNHEGQVRNPGDMHCGGLPGPRTFIQSLKRVKCPLIQETTMCTILRGASHIQHEIIHSIRRRLRTPQDYSMQRARYILGDLEESKFMSNLMRDQKKNEYSQDMLHIYELYVNVITEKLRKLIEYLDARGNSGKDKLDKIQDEIREIRRLRKYVMEQLYILSLNYSMGVHVIYFSFKISHHVVSASKKVSIEEWCAE